MIFTIRKLRKYLRFVFAIVCVALVAVFLTACMLEGESTTDETGALTEDIQTAEERVYLSAKTNWRIIVSSDASTEIVDLARNLSVSIFQKAKITIPLSTDAKEASDYEIFVGMPTKRECVSQVTEQMSYTSCDLHVTERQIFVCGFSPSAIQQAVSAFCDSIQKDENGNWYVPLNLTYFKDISYSDETVPKFDNNFGKFEGVYDCGSSHYQVSASNVTVNQVNEYQQKLADMGYSQISTNEISGNCFATYEKAKTEVFTFWYPNINQFKVVWGEKKVKPDTEPLPAASVTTSKLIQLSREGATESSPNGAPGMCLIYQLSDGGFLLIDGGPKNEADKKALYNYLKENTSEEKPRISCWLITHAHNDHIELVNQFLEQYSSKVILESVGYNFPNYDTLTMNADNPTLLGGYVRTFLRLLNTKYKTAKQYILHTGQELNFPGCRVEVLLTQEDVFPDLYATGNHTSAAFRITTGDKTAIILGDCEQPLCKKLDDLYGSDLKSDILQVSHHGFNGGYLSLYQHIDPDICIWACDQYRFENDQRCFRTFDFNRYLRDDSIKKRTHYHAGETTVIPLS